MDPNEITFDEIYANEQGVSTHYENDNTDLTFNAGDEDGQFLIGAGLRERSLTAIARILKDPMAEYSDLVRAADMLAKLEKVNLAKAQAIIDEKRAQRQEAFQMQKHKVRLDASERDYQMRLKNAEQTKAYREEKLRIDIDARDRRHEFEKQYKRAALQTKIEMGQRRIDRIAELREKDIEAKQETHRRLAESKYKAIEARGEVNKEIEEQKQQNRKKLLREKITLMNERDVAQQDAVNQPMQITFTNAMEEKLGQGTKRTSPIELSPESDANSEPKKLQGGASGDSDAAPSGTASAAIEGSSRDESESEDASVPVVELFRRDRSEVQHRVTDPEQQPNVEFSDVRDALLSAGVQPTVWAPARGELQSGSGQTPEVEQG